MKYLVYILFIIALAYNTFPLALGLNRDKRNSHFLNVLLAVVFGLIQAAMYRAGALLGDTFMHLFEEQDQFAVFAILLAVSVRMMIEAFKIRRGERVFSFDNYVKFVMMAVAAGINTLIVGMTYSYLDLFGHFTPAALLAAGFAWSIAGISMNLSRVNILLSSLIQLISAVIILFIGIAYLFTNHYF